MKPKFKRIILHLFLIIVAFFQIVPIVIITFNSFRTDKEIKKFPIGFPTQININNFIDAWKIGGYARAYLNSITVSIITTLIVLLFAMLMGYFIAKTKIRIKNFLIIYFGVAMSIPLLSYLAPLYYGFSEMNLVNSHVGLILIYIAMNLPFNILLARTYILGIPNELSEAAVIDGCTTFQIIGKIIFPLSKPIATTIALIAFVSTWNEFTVANTFLQDTVLKTVSTRYVLFVAEKGSNLAMIFTAGMISMIPIVFVFVLLQNYFVEGMTAGSIKS
ncbi:MAG: ABC-type sugar transport system, permease component [Firmicutes bacterium]|nr:ABC-type sugar transport system, permease component [Bacillota bacterium]